MRSRHLLRINAVRIQVGMTSQRRIYSRFLFKSEESKHGISNCSRVYRLGVVIVVTLVVDAGFCLHKWEPDKL